MTELKILHLTLKKKWFDMIKSGQKKEEYRELKPYFYNRFIKKEGGFNSFDRILFINGYSPKSPRFEIEWKGIRVDEGNIEWGAEKGVKYFVISLGEIIKK